MLFQVCNVAPFRDNDQIYAAGYFVESDTDLARGWKGEHFRRLPVPPTVERLHDVVKACDWYVERLLDESVPDDAIPDVFYQYIVEWELDDATFAGCPQSEYLDSYLASLIDSAAKLPDAPPVPIDAIEFHTPQNKTEKVTIAKRLRQWAAEGVGEDLPPIEAESDDTESEPEPDPWADYRVAPGEPLLTVDIIKDRFDISGSTLSKNEKARETRRISPDRPNKYVYRYDVVSLIANQKPIND